MEGEGLLPVKDVCQWRSAYGDDTPKPADGERVMLVSHIHRGLGIPPSSFFLEVLAYYGLQPHNLTPNSNLYIAGFQALFEGYMGIAPRLYFFKHCFHIKRQTVEKELVICGIVSLNLCRHREDWFPKVPKVDSVKAWTGTYFYCKDVLAPGKPVGIPAFQNIAGVVQPSWNEDAVKVLPADLRLIKRRIEKLTSSEPKLTGVNTVLCWLQRRIQPLKHHDRLLCKYSGEKTDSLRISEDDLVEEELVYQLKQLVADRTQFVESRPMFCSTNSPPELSALTEDDLAPVGTAASKSKKRKEVGPSAAAAGGKRKRKNQPVPANVPVIPIEDDAVEGLNLSGPISSLLQA